MAAMVSASIGDGESSGLKVQEAIWKDATHKFFRADVLNVDFATSMLRGFPT